MRSSGGELVAVGVGSVEEAQGGGSTSVCQQEIWYVTEIRAGTECACSKLSEMHEKAAC